MVFKKARSDNVHNGDIQGNYNPAYETHGDEKPENNVKVCIFTILIMNMKYFYKIIINKYRCFNLLLYILLYMYDK